MKREHFWRSIDGFFTFPDFYSWLPLQFAHPPHIVEVGAYEGQSAAYLAVEMANHLGGRLDLVDNFGWKEESVERVRSALAPVADIIGELRMSDSAEAARRYDDASLDAVFIDADHWYPSVRRDIDAWLPKVKRGGIIAGHDLAPEFPGVLQAVSETFPRWECWRGERWGDERMRGTGEYYSVWSVRI